MKINKTNRQEGQIWIDRRPPYNLKYYVDGKTFEVKTENSYLWDPTEDIYAGQVLAIDSYSDEGNPTLKKAEFPKDINRVVGVSLIAEKGNAIKGKHDFTIASDGFVDLNRADVENVFESYTKSFDISNADSQPEDLKKYIGKKVYWSTDSNSAGKLTLNTPNPKITYNNLPVIGNIIEIDGVKEDDGVHISKLKIQLNFSRFDSSIGWKYKYKYTPVWDEEGKLVTSYKIPIDTGLKINSDISSIKTFLVGQEYEEEFHAIIRNNVNNTTDILINWPVAPENVMSIIVTGVTQLEEENKLEEEDKK